MQALFDNGDFFTGQAVEGIDVAVDLGLPGGNMSALSASVVRSSWFRRRCNELTLTRPESRKRRSVWVLAYLEV